jgi:2-keto-3-deoxy-L-rhamnonate aldolase RhmA
MPPTNRWTPRVAAAIAALAAPLFVSGAETQRANPLIARLAAGRPALGVWTAASAAPRIAKVLATSGADFIVADVEHDVYDFASLRTFLLGVQDFARRYGSGGGAPPSVIVKLGHRAGWDGRFEIAETLKLGPVAGIWVPFVESRADLERVISAVRGAETSALAGLNIPRERRDVWPLDPQGELIVVAMIESEAGARRAEEIVATPGVTAIEPVHLSAADTARVVALCKAKNVIAATNAGPDDVTARLAEGYRLISVGWDYVLLRDALSDTFKRMRPALR